MSRLITGLHHITALASNPQKNIDFYAGVLGLRLVKKTINFDAPEVYHLYYGNERGEPGTIMTFFPYPEIPQGRKGKGQLTLTSFSIPESSIHYWMKRFSSFNVTYKEPEERFDEIFIYFEDHDGLSLELVAGGMDERPGFTYGNIPQEFAIKGFYGMTLSEECSEKTASLLMGQLDHVLIAEMGNRFRYSTTGKPGNFVDVLCNPDALRGLSGYGTVHHVAFATANEKTQNEGREKLLKIGLDVTPVLDREYFRSIYFREPGGVLFEIATIPPGFTVDEPIECLGEALMLPKWEEQNRTFIEKKLFPVQLNVEDFADDGYF